MSCVRVFFAWLVLAALPLHGIAAHTVLPCQSHGPAVADAAAHAMAALHQPASNGHAQLHGPQPTAPSAGASSPPHQCATCGSCCEAASICTRLLAMVAAPLPRAEPDEPVRAIAARPLPAPFKPPRA